MRGNFDNTTRLVSFILRRERVTSSLWIFFLVLFMTALAPAVGAMFPDGEARRTFAAGYDTPVMVAMMGPSYLTEGGYSTGALYAAMMLLWAILAVAIMNIFLVVRHTRADEERGRTEVVRSLPVGRLAGLHATMLSAVIVNAVLAVLTGIGLAVAGTDGMYFGGSMLFGAVLGASGLVFAAVAAVFCQLSAHSGGAAGLSFLTLGGFYMLRAAGDVGAEILALISPLGLALRARVFAGNQIFPVLILLGLSVLIAALAYKLCSLRDLGQGFIAARPGKETGGALMKSPLGLSLRLCRGAMIVWLIVMFSLGASYGSIVPQIDQFVADSPEYLAIVGVPAEMLDILSDEDKRDMIIDSFGMFINSTMALFALVPLILFAKKLRGEEKDGRAEMILSGAVSRGRYFLGFVAIAFAASVLMPLAAAFGLYSAAAAATGGANPFVLGQLLQANFSFMPALWVLLGLSVLVAGCFPKRTGAVWAYYGFICFLTLMGNLPDVPEWLKSLSPLHHVPAIQVTDFSLPGAPGNGDPVFLPLTVMAGIALALTAAGLVGYSRRDMQG